MRQFIIALLFAFTTCASGQVAEPQLRDELLAMEKVDQEERNKCSGDAEAQARCLVRIAETVDAPNTRRLEKIFDKHGFPTRKAVGSEGVSAFMILLQHAPTDALREKAVKPITRAFEAKELSPQDYSNFIDRFRLHKGKGQLYGTGFETREGKLVLSKTEDIRNLEKRRKQIGLPPMVEYVKMLREMYKLDVEMPRIDGN